MKNKTVYPHLGIIDEFFEYEREEAYMQNKIKYELQEQQYGSVFDFSPVKVEDDVIFQFNNLKNYGDAVLKIVSNANYFFAIKDGECIVPKSALVGKIGVCVLCDVGAIPCTGLVAFVGDDGKTVIIPDATDVLKRLKKAESDISSLISDYKKVTEIYKGLESRITRLFSQYNF